MVWFGSGILIPSPISEGHLLQAASISCRQKQLFHSQFIINMLWFRWYCFIIYMLWFRRIPVRTLLKDFRQLWMMYVMIRPTALNDSRNVQQLWMMVWSLLWFDSGAAYLYLLQFLQFSWLTMTVHSKHYLIGANLFDPSSVLLLKPIKLEIMNTTKMSQRNMLSEGSPDSRVCPSTIQALSSNEASELLFWAQF